MVRTGEKLEKRNLEGSYFSIYCMTVKLNMDERYSIINPRTLYMFFGCTLDGKKKYISSVFKTDVIKASDWYNYFQGLKKRGIEHIIYGLVPNIRELKDGIKLGYPKIEIFTSCERAIEKLKKYNTYKKKEEIYKEVRKLYVAKDIVEYELAYKEFLEKYEKYPFIMDIIGEEIKSLKVNYKYSYEIRRIVYAFNYIIEMEKRFSILNRNNIYTEKEEFIEDCASFIYPSEAAMHYKKDEWSSVLNEIYEDKKELIKPYL